MKLLNKLKILIGVFFFLLSSTALAQRCDFIDGNNSVDRIVPLIGGNITVGRDVPLGTVIFTQKFFSSTAQSNFSCESGTYDIIRDYKLTSTPLPLSSWSGANAGYVYESGVPGIGVFLGFVSGRVIPFTDRFQNCGEGTAACNWNFTVEFNIYLIKTGDVSPGTIQGVMLPSMQEDVSSPENTLIIQRESFVGSINVVSRTCITPDVNVPLGTHSVGEFTGVGSGTAWKNFNISLNNCPAFHGTFPGADDINPVFDAAGDTSTEQGRTSNVLGFRLDPTDGIIDAANGIISLTPAPSGFLPAATGIGIQIGTGDAVPAPVPLATIRSSGIATTATEGGSYVIPLSARYIQTASALTPGPANGAVVFTIDYQ